MTTSAREQSSRLASLLRNERAALADFLVALADFDEKRLWVELGYTSLFWFLHRELGLSKGAAFYRKTAAELLQRFPSLLDPLADGQICLTTVAELAKVLTPENQGEVLPRFFQLSRREAAEVTAALAPEPAPPLRDVVTAARTRMATPALALPPAAPAQDTPRPSDPLVTPEPGSNPLPPRSGSPVNLAHANFGVPGVSSAPRPRPAPPDMEVEPLTAELRRLHVTVSKRLLDKLDAARDALSHSLPGANAGDIIEAALDLVLERTAKRRGLVKKPRSAPSPRPAGEREAPPARTRYIPAAVRRAVWLRDEGKCQWRLDSGGICGSTLRAEVDHIDGLARGAGASVDDLRLLCRMHQDVSARRLYGDKLMDNYTRPKGGGCSERLADDSGRGFATS